MHPVPPVSCAYRMHRQFPPEDLGVLVKPAVLDSETLTELPVQHFPLPPCF